MIWSCFNCVSGVVDALPNDTLTGFAKDEELPSCKAVLEAIKFEEKPSCIKIDV